MPKFGKRQIKQFWQGLASNGRGTNQFPAAASPGVGSTFVGCVVAVAMEWPPLDLGVRKTERGMARYG